ASALSQHREKLVATVVTAVCLRHASEVIIVFWRELPLVMPTERQPRRQAIHWVGQRGTDAIYAVRRPADEIGAARARWSGSGARSAHHGTGTGPCRGS